MYRKQQKHYGKQTNTSSHFSFPPVFFVHRIRRMQLIKVPRKGKKLEADNAMLQQEADRARECDIMRKPVAGMLCVWIQHD